MKNNDFIIVEDTRNQIKKHQLKHTYWEKIGQKYIRSKLYVGDYARLDNQTVCIDTKKELSEVAQNICGKSHERFREEVIRAKENNIKLIILVESAWDRETAWNWSSKYTKVKGATIMKAIMSMEKRYGVEFIFCSKREAPKKILEILKNVG